MPLLPGTGSSGYGFPADPIGTPKHFGNSTIEIFCQAYL